MIILHFGDISKGLVVFKITDKLIGPLPLRMNKLAMNKGREKVDEVLSFSRMNCGLLKDMNIVDAAIGTSHCIVLNGCY